MCAKTTYSESYLKNEEPCIEKPIVPCPANVFPYGGEFHDKTIYKESYLESTIDRVEPIIPCNAITKADGKISADTTSKVQSRTRSTLTFSFSSAIFLLLIFLTLHVYFFFLFTLICQLVELPTTSSRETFPDITSKQKDVRRGPDAIRHYEPLRFRGKINATTRSYCPVRQSSKR